MIRKIEKTDDGSATLFVPELNEHYHSTKGALTESQHIFIDMGLKSSAAIHPQVLEVGLGTGLNAWLTLQEAERSQRKITYTALELYPLEWELIEQLNYIAPEEQLEVEGKTQSANVLFKKIHTAPWEEETSLTPHFSLMKHEADARQWNTSSQKFDVIYFDAFAPEKQFDLWTQELFNRLYVLVNEGGLLTTYCAKGVVRRMLQTAGFTVERLPGPPGGKREILRANK